MKLSDATDSESRPGTQHPGHHGPRSSWPAHSGIDVLKLRNLGQIENARCMITVAHVGNICTSDVAHACCA
jgi:hypothetical protein